MPFWKTLSQKKIIIKSYPTFPLTNTSQNTWMGTMCCNEHYLECHQQAQGGGTACGPVQVQFNGWDLWPQEAQEQISSARPELLQPLYRDSPWKKRLPLEAMHGKVNSINRWRGANITLNPPQLNWAIVIQGFSEAAHINIYKKEMQLGEPV